MRPFSRIGLPSVAMLAVMSAAASGSEGNSVPGLDYVRNPDVIYARKHGVALTMDVLAPSTLIVHGQADKVAKIEFLATHSVGERAFVGIKRDVCDAEVGAEGLPAIGAHRAKDVQ